MRFPHAADGGWQSTVFVTFHEFIISKQPTSMTKLETDPTLELPVGKALVGMRRVHDLVSYTVFGLIRSHSGRSA